MENLMGSQNSLNRKLKEECCKLGAKLEELSHHSRSELEQLTLEKQHLEDTVKRLRARCSEMEEQCVQHGRMHQRMKDRRERQSGRKELRGRLVMTAWKPAAGTPGGEGVAALGLQKLDRTSGLG
ncbi:hypothetical protein XENORESO_014203 [Xenotaenia resolanae]|uniref:Uncharacterized protein n=1 Tax=Xenotaenia resolanae TaxID=208358 RepID=A0ABV0X4S9_9TELE